MIFQTTCFIFQVDNPWKQILNANLDIYIVQTNSGLIYSVGPSTFRWTVLYTDPTAASVAQWKFANSDHTYKLCIFVLGKNKKITLKSYAIFPKHWTRD